MGADHKISAHRGEYSTKEFGAHEGGPFQEAPEVWVHGKGRLQEHLLLQYIGIQILYSIRPNCASRVFHLLSTPQVPLCSSEATGLFPAYAMINKTFPSMILKSQRIRYRQALRPPT